LRAVNLSLPALCALFTLPLRWELSLQCTQCSIAPSVINMTRVHSDNSVLRHLLRPTTLDSANLSINNTQHDIIASVAAEGSTDGTSNGVGAPAPTQDGSSIRQRRRFQRQNGHTRRQFSAQERRDVAAVRRVGACEVCRRRKTRCRHTVRPFGPASDTSVTSSSTSSHHSPAVGLCQPLLQVSNTSTTWPASVERRVGSLLQSTDLEPMLSGHIYKNPSLARYMNEPVAFSLIPEFGDQHVASSWKSRRNLIAETLHNTDRLFPPNSPTDRSLHPLPANEHWPIHDAFDENEDIFAMERFIRLSAAEHWTQLPIAWPAEAESHFGYTQPLSHSQVSYTGSQFYFGLYHTFPQQDSFSLADSVASTTQWNGCATRHAWNDFEKEEFMDGHPLQSPPQCQEWASKNSDRVVSSN
ncbi:hypothetical protein N431DRAFT_524702, partial [Stipitochalara longipes BDJ]